MKKFGKKIGNFKKKAISLLLSAVLIVSTGVSFIGCTPKNENTKEKESKVAVATSVNYRTDGIYQTTLTIPDDVEANFDGLTAQDVSAQYTYFDRDKYESDKSATIEAAVEGGDSNTVTGGVDSRKYYVDGQAVVKEIAASGRQMTVSFEDNCVDHRYTDAYVICVDSKEVSAIVNVNKSSISLSLVDENKKIYATDKDILLSVTIDGSSFSSDLSANDIKLSGSFEDMQAQVVSKSERSATLQLTGDVKKYEDANLYLDGTVEIAPSGVENASDPISLSMPITVDAARLVAEELAVKGTDFTLPIELGAVVGMGLTDFSASNITFVPGISLNEEAEQASEPVVVKGFEKTDETRGVLTLGIEGATTLNEAAKIINGCDVTIVGAGEPITFAAGVAAAGFYPVFDYVELKGENLELTLLLHADHGKFGQLSADAVSFGNDFEGASVVSLNKTDDLNATLVISVPANGQTADTFDIGGEIELASGTLVNSWEETSTEPVSYFRRYSQESLGRDLSQGDIDIIKNIVGGFGNTPFGTITSVVSGGASVVSGVITVLEITGIRKSERVMLQEITKSLEQIKTTLDQQTVLLEQLVADNLHAGVDKFTTLLMNLNDRCGRIQTYLEAATNPDKSNRAYLGLPVPTEPVKKDGETDEAFAERQAAYETEMQNYGTELINAILAAEAKGTGTYRNFTNTYNELAGYFNDVANEIIKSDNVINQYDELCKYLFNFETSTYNSRYAFRYDAYCALARGISFLMMYYGNDMQNGTLLSLRNQFINAKDVLKNSGFYEKNGEHTKIQCYSLNKTMYNELDIEYWGRDPYVGYRMGFADSTDAFDDGTDLDETARGKFLTRMQGRTILEELKLARFWNLDDCLEKATYSYIDGQQYQKDISGVAFFCWDESKYFLFKGTYYYYYAIVMDWNSKDYQSKMCSYSKTGEVWYRYATWCVAS